MSDAPDCPECGKQAQLEMTIHGPRYSCCHVWAWGKTALADEKTHKARIEAHAAIDPLWKFGLLSRSEVYAQLAAILGIEPKRCHIKLMNLEEAKRVKIAALQIGEK